jgi:PAS domain S-box-containing protein
MASDLFETSIGNVIFDNAPDAIVVWVQDENFSQSRIIEANPSACARYGYSRSEIVKLTGSDLTAPESQETSLTIPSLVEENGRATIEVIHITRDRRLIPTEMNARLFELGGTKFVVAVCRDISSRKDSERKNQELLEREKELRMKCQADIDMRTNYTRALVHELKTPLTSLMASSDYLVSHIRKEPLLSFAKNINFGAKAVNHRIDELHDLIKLELGTLNLEFYPVNLRQLLREVTEFVRPAAERAELAFSLELPSRLPRVWGDRERLQQVVMNLLNNAFKYTPKKGKVNLKAYTQPGELVVEVLDTGCGMSPEAQKALFQPYERRDPSQQRKDGLGLGLVITKAIVERYKGRIWVESKLGSGSRFFVALPTVKKGGKNESADH